MDPWLVMLSAVAGGGLVLSAMSTSPSGPVLVRPPPTPTWSTSIPGPSWILPIPGSLLSSRQAPPASLVQVRFSDGMRARWLPTIESLRAYADQVGHDIDQWMQPYLLGNGMVFAYAMMDEAGVPVGSFVLRWMGTRWTIAEAQGRGEAPVSPAMHANLVQLCGVIDPQGCPEGYA